MDAATTILDSQTFGRRMAAEALARERWINACEHAYDRVYRGLVAMGAAPADAADAVQDAFERALRIKAPPRSVDGWLFVVALRQWKRQRWRQRLFSPLDALRNFSGQTPNEPDDQIVLFAELAKLTERQRTVLVARFALGLSQREIAELLQVTPGTVGATTAQALQRLRARLDQENIDEPSN